PARSAARLARTARVGPILPPAPRMRSGLEMVLMKSIKRALGRVNTSSNADSSRITSGSAPACAFAPLPGAFCTNGQILDCRSPGNCSCNINFLSHLRQGVDGQISFLMPPEKSRHKKQSPVKSFSVSLQALHRFTAEALRRVGLSETDAATG